MDTRLNALPRLLMLAAGVCAVTGMARAQDPSSNPPDSMPNRGFFPGSSYSIENIEAINNITGNVTLAIPLGSLPPGRGGSSYGLNLIYNSAVFDFNEVATSNDLLLHLKPSAIGNWNYAYDYGISYDTRPQSSSATCAETFYRYKAYLLMPDGSRRNLRLPAYSDNNGDSYYAVAPDGTVAPACGTYTPPVVNSSTKLIYVTFDSSFIRVEVTPLANTWTIYASDGTVINGTGWYTAQHPNKSASATAVETITDRNGNAISISQSCPTGQPCTRTISDGFASKYPRRAIVITYGADAGGTQDTITWPGNGMTLTAKVNWSTVSLGSRTYVCSPTTSATCTDTLSVPAVSSIVLPAAKSGGPQLSYGFDYNCLGTGCTNWGELHTLTLPTQATVKYSYWFDTHTRTAATTPINMISSKTVGYTATSGDISQTTQTTSYGHTSVNYGPATVVTAPDGSTTTYVYSPPPLSPCVSPEGCIPAGLLLQVIPPDSSGYQYFWYANSIPGCSGAVGATSTCAPNPYVQTATRYDANQAHAANTVNVVDKNGNLTRSDAYDWLPMPATGNGALLRTTTSQYYNPTATAPNAASMSDPNAYWNTAAPRYLRAAQVSKVLSSAGAVLAATQWAYDNIGTTANPTAEYRWDSTKAASYPGDPVSGSTGVTLSSSNAVVQGATYGVGGNIASLSNPNQYPNATVGVNYDSDSLYPYQVVVASGKPEQRTINLVFDSSSGLLSSTTDDNGVQTSYGYDLIERPTSTEQKATAGGLDRWSYSVYDDAALTVTTKQDKNTTNDQALVSTRYFDPLGRLRLEVDPAGNSVKTGYWAVHTDQDVGSNYVVTSNPYTTTSDSTMGWTLTTRSPSGQNWGTVQTSYYGGSALPAPFGPNTTLRGTASTNSVERTASSVDEAGKSHSYSFDALGRLVTADATANTYDALDNLLTAGGNRTFFYTSLSRLRQATNPEMGSAGGTVTYLYDNNGNLTSEKDGRGITTCFGIWTGTACDWSTKGYDYLNRPRQKTYSDSTPSVAYTWDADVKGTLASVGNSVSTTSYTHDMFGRVTGSVQNTGGQAYPFAYAYNLADFMTSETYPSGRAVNYTPDTANRLSAITNGQSDVYVNQIQNKAFGGIGQMAFGNGVTETATWNDRLQQTAVGATRTSGSMLTLNLYPCASQQVSCSSGNNGSILTQSVQIPGSTFTQNYTYDSQNRLLTAQETGGWAQTYVYDSPGNRALLSGAQYYIPGGSWSPQVATNSASAVAAIFPGNRWSGATYDSGAATGAGAVTGLSGWTFTYDAENRLIAETSSLSTVGYSYDGLDQRVHVNTATLVYDAKGDLAAEYGTATASPCGTSRCYVTVDHLGSTRLVTDATGNAMRRYDYLPFGEEIPAGAFGRTTAMGYQSVGDGFNPKFTGQMRDSVTGLDFFNARWYDPAQGAFLSPDPENAASDVADTQSWNGFAYVANNPLIGVDPTGLGQDSANCIDWSPYPAGPNSGSGTLALSFYLYNGSMLDQLKAWIFSYFQPVIQAGPENNYVSQQTNGVPAPGVVNAHDASTLFVKSTGEIVGLEYGLIAPLDLSGMGAMTYGALKRDPVGLAFASVGFLPAAHSFSSFGSLKVYLGSAGQGMAWHHIVEQSQTLEFGAAAINSTANIVKVRQKLHTAISAYYSSKKAFTGGQTVRQWLRGKSWKEQFEFGLEVLRKAQIGTL
jgi:RHS repeat-associated protein